MTDHDSVYKSMLRELGIERIADTDARTAEERKQAMERSVARYLAAEAAEKPERDRRIAQEIAAFESAPLPDDLYDLPASADLGGPPTIIDKARANKTVTEATFGGPRNYTQETAEWPGGKQ